MRRGIVRSATVPTAAGQIIGANPRRVAILFSAASAGYAVSTEPAVTMTTGLLVQLVTRVQITREEHGDAVTKPWYGITTPSALPVAYLEVTEEE